MNDDGVPLRDRERATLEDAEEFLTRVRSALHLETGRRTDRLVLDHQPAIARAMGFIDEPRLIAEDGLMRAVFEHARQVSRILADAFARRAGGHGHRGRARRADPRAGGVLDALARTAEAGVPASPQLLDEIEAADVPDPVAWDPEVRDAFLRLLRAGEPAAQALDTLDRLGLLARFLPAWAAVRCRPQRDPYHRYTVDTHLTTASPGCRRCSRRPTRTTPWSVTPSTRPPTPTPCSWAPCCTTSGRSARAATCRRDARSPRALASMGSQDPTRELATFMVAQHLLLPDTATRRDLTDEDLILNVAATIATPERLAALYLLAKADAAATGPAAWTPWRQALVRELVAKVRRVFEPRGDGGGAGRPADGWDRPRARPPRRRA